MAGTDSLDGVRRMESAPEYPLLAGIMCRIYLHIFSAIWNDDNNPLIELEIFKWLKICLLTSCVTLTLLMRNRFCQTGALHSEFLSVFSFIRRYIWKKLVIGFIAAVAMASGNATVIIDNTITGSITNNFNALASGFITGTLSQTGATYGERFSGQVLTSPGGVDSLSGLPTNPLGLLPNATAGLNIGVLSFGGSQVLYGFNNAIGSGEGAVSILLGAGSDVFGLNVVGTNAGAFTAQFFRSNGSLIASITESGLADGFFGFRATGGDAIAGVSITNLDVGGIGYDNVTFNGSASVPEPGSLALLALGLTGLAFSRRKKA